MVEARHYRINGGPRRLLDDTFPKSDGCCRMCHRPVDPQKDLRDPKSIREYDISGLCQKCQDVAFFPMSDE